MRASVARITGTAALAASVSLLTAAPAPATAAGEEERAKKAAQRTISLGNFIVNRDVTPLGPGRTTTVDAACPGKTRFFTFGFRPFGVPRTGRFFFSNPFVVRSVIPRPNGVRITFFNPGTAFPGINIRVSAMCLTLGTVSAAAAGGDQAIAAAKKKKGKGKGKGKPKLKTRVVTKTVKVGVKKKQKKGKKKRKGAKSSARARAAFGGVFDLAIYCRGRDEIPTAFGFDHGATSQFLGLSLDRRGGDVGLVGNFLFDGIDRLKFFVACMQARGPFRLGATVDGIGSPGDLVNHFSTKSPSKITSLSEDLNELNYNGNLVNGAVPGVGMPPVPADSQQPPVPINGRWFGNEIDPLLGGLGFFAPRDPNGAIYQPRTVASQLAKSARINYTQFGTPDDGISPDPFAPDGMTAPPAPVGATQCSDTIDNADPEDTAIDLADPGCLSAADVDEADLTGTGPCPPTGTTMFSGALPNAGSTMQRHQLTINGLVEVDKLDFEPDFLTGSTVIMGVVCSGGTVVDVMVSWTVVGTTVTYDFSVAHVSGPGGDSFDKTIAADTR